MNIENKNHQSNLANVPTIEDLKTCEAYIIKNMGYALWNADRSILYNFDMDYNYTGSRICNLSPGKMSSVVGGIYFKTNINNLLNQIQVR